MSPVRNNNSKNTSLHPEVSNGVGIDVQNLCFAYKDQAQILKNISFQLAQGAFLSIAGPNGSGKTTLLNLLAGFLKPISGSITIDAAALPSYSIRRLAKKIAFVRQEFIPVFEFSAIQVVSMARTPYLGALAFETDADKKAVEQALELTDTARFADRPLNHLSGGERQRIFIARALAQQTPILLLDEPTSFLDMKHQVGIYDLLKKLQLENHKTIIAATHDINLATQYSDLTLLLAANGPPTGEVSLKADDYQFGPTPEVLSAERIENVFGVKTFSAQIGQTRFFFPLGKFTKNHSSLGL